MVELGFIADQINQKGNEAICDKLVNKGTTTTTAIYTNLFDAINSQTNLVRVERDINQAKGAAMSNVLDAFSRSSKKTKVKRLDCSLSHDMTRLSFHTVGSCQLSN